MITVRAESSTGQLYGERYAKLNVLAQRAGNRPAQTCLTDRSVLPKGEFFNSEFYADFLRPRDVHSILSVYLLSHGAARLAFGRPHRAGEWEREHIDALSRFAPHLHSAARINIRLEGTRLTETDVPEVLDQIAQGVIIVDAESRPEFVSQAAQRILGEADGLGVGCQGLHTASRSETAALRRMIAQAASGSFDRDSDGVLGVSRPSLRRPLSIIVIPLRRRVSWFLPEQSRAIVFVRDPERTAAMPETDLRQLYGLTSAEASLAMEVARGTGLQAAADRTGVTLATARTHLQHIFQKTRTHRQAELVRLIAEMQWGIVFEKRPACHRIGDCDFVQSGGPWRAASGWSSR
jgi:DNA-binding CsgD family transcriptional regulator/PAS domain-containing protein